MFFKPCAHNNNFIDVRLDVEEYILVI